DHHLLGELEAPGATSYGRDVGHHVGQPGRDDGLDVEDVVRVDDAGSFAHHDVPHDVQVARAAEAASVPGQLRPEGGAPARVDDQPEGAQVGPDAPHGDAALVDP